MIPAGRSSRRASGQRWLIVGLVVTSFVLLVDASIKSAGPTTGRRLAGEAWADRALVIVGQSNLEGAELAGFRTATTTATTAGLTPLAVTTDLTTLTSSAKSTYRQLQSIREPTSLQTAAGLLDTCLQVRSQAAATIATAVETALGAPASSTPGAAGSGVSGAAGSGAAGSGAAGSGTTTTTVGAATSPTTVGAGAVVATTDVSPRAAASTFAAAIGQLRVADEAYQLFAADLSASLGVTAPPSTWVTSDGLYSTPNLEVFLTALQQRVSLAPVHLLTIVSIGTTPSAVATTGPRQSVAVLAPSSTLTVTALVGNLGNQDETDLTVRATISAATGTASVTRPVELAAGAVAAVDLPHLAPRLGQTITLTVTVTAPGGTARPVQKVIRFEMPAPTSSTTTTTVAPSTTVPPSTTVGAPTTVPAPATTVPAPATTVPAPATTVPAPATTAPAATVPATTTAPATTAPPIAAPPTAATAATPTST
jgi:S-DNA-T family DNA segregation ATPase FtsK/SpoIIIE